MVTTFVQTNKTEQNQTVTSRIAPWLIRLVYPLATRLIFPYFFKKIIIQGQENIPKTGAVIIAPTHRSRWDALIVPYATGKLVSGRNPHFMVSANEMKGIQGWFIERLGGFPVNTERVRVGTLNHSFELLCQGEMVVIFPEGNIYRTNDVQPLKRGIAKIALEVEMAKPEVEVKILPVTIKYSESIPQRGCSVSVQIGEGLTVKNYHGKSLRESSFLLTADLEKSLTKNNHFLS